MTASSLAPLLDNAGLVLGLAFDHRDSLDVLLREVGLGNLGLGGIRTLKETVVRAVAPEASAVMLDHTYGAAAIASGAIPAGVGLVMPLEAQGYAQLGDERRVSLAEDFGASRCARARCGCLQAPGSDAPRSCRVHGRPTRGR